MSVRLFTPPALATAAEIEDPLPTPDTAPSGCAAYCGTVAHCQRAIQNIDQRLRANPGLPLSLDLEGRLGGRLGHIELLQVHVDPSCEGEKPLTCMSLTLIFWEPISLAPVCFEKFWRTGGFRRLFIARTETRQHFSSSITFTCVAHSTQELPTAFSDTQHRQGTGRAEQ